MVVYLFVFSFEEDIMSNVVSIIINIDLYITCLEGGSGPIMDKGLESMLVLVRPLDINRVRNLDRPWDPEREAWRLTEIGWRSRA